MKYSDIPPKKQEELGVTGCGIKLILFWCEIGKYCVYERKYSDGTPFIHRMETPPNGYDYEKYYERKRNEYLKSGYKEIVKFNISSFETLSDEELYQMSSGITRYKMLLFLRDYANRKVKNGEVYNKEKRYSKVVSKLLDESTHEKEKQIIISQANRIKELQERIRELIDERNLYKEKLKQFNHDLNNIKRYKRSVAEIKRLIGTIDFYTGEEDT